MSQRDAYIEKLHAKIDEWNADIDKLMAKANQLEADSRMEYKRQAGILKRKREEIERKLNEIKVSGGGAWEDLKSGMDLAWESMNEAVKSALSRFKQV